MAGGLENQPAGSHQVLPRAPAPKLSRIRRVSLCDSRRSQEGTAGQERAVVDAGPDAVDTTALLAPGRLTMLEFDDIQYLLLARVPALTGRYEFLSFHEPVEGRAWLKAILDRVQ